MNKRPTAVLIGAGGHAEALLELNKLTETAQIIGFVDRTAESTLEALPHLGDDTQISTLTNKGITHFILGVGSTNVSPLRQRLFDQALEAGLQPLTLIHPSAILSPSAKLGKGVQIMPGTIVHTGADIGSNVILNSGCIIEHHARIGNHTHIASGACLAGAVHIGTNCFIGARAVLRNGIEIGSGSTIGMGSVVTQSFPANTTAYGVPAKQKQA